MSEENKQSPYKKILVIDDNDIDRYIAGRNIKKYSFSEETVLKESAIVALQYLASLESAPEELPQLIFLDILMPEMNGFEFLEAYAKLPEVIKKSYIVIMLSTSLNPDDHERTKNNQYVTRFVNKPIDKKELKELEEFFTSEQNKKN